MKNNKITAFVLSLLVFVFASKAYSQDSITTDTTKSIYDMSLEELMQLKVTVASPNAKPLIEIPNIITVITEQDIKKSGANNLLELLKYVPGIDFGAELDHVIGIGIRGNNATEGKVLLLIDGQAMNETNYGSFDFGQHIPLDNIKRIEILRGPGSPVYGGLAELAVISIITKTGSDLKGAQASVTYNYSQNATLNQDIQLAYGDKLKNGFEYSISGYKYWGNRSNLIVNTYNNEKLNYADSSAFQNNGVNLEFTYKGVNFRYIYDLKEFDNLQKRIGKILFDGHHIGLNYEWKLNEKLIVKPSFSWKQMKPWQFIGYDDYKIYNTTNTRYLFNVNAIYKLNKNIDFVFGTDYFINKGKKDEDTLYSNNKNTISYSTIAAFTELAMSSRFANFTVGARYDYHNVFGSAFVPRFAITKVVKKNHFKLMLSEAFKSPTIQNIDINNNIKPEVADVAEFEVGHQFTKNILFNINFFWLDIKKAIVYLWADNKDHYINYDKTGTNGLEFVFRAIGEWGGVNLNYSLYLARKSNKVPDYMIEGKDHIYGAYPNHKISMTSYFNFGKHITISPSMIFYGERYTYLSDGDNLHLQKYEPELLMNLFFTYSNPFYKGIDLTIGVNDITNQKYQFINAYKAGIEPIYSAGREFVFKLSLKI